MKRGLFDSKAKVQGRASLTALYVVGHAKDRQKSDEIFGRLGYSGKLATVGSKAGLKTAANWGYMLPQFVPADLS